MLCRFCFSHRDFGCFDLVCLIVSSICVIFPIGIMVICNIICSWMGHIYAATPGQNPGVARIYIYMCISLYFWSNLGFLRDYIYSPAVLSGICLKDHHRKIRRFYPTSVGHKQMQADYQGKIPSGNQPWQWKTAKPPYKWRIYPLVI